MPETLKDGRVIHGGPSDVKGRTSLTAAEKKTLKMQMYNDFLTAKGAGQISLGATFDTWLRNAAEMLRTRRKKELDDDLNVGRISQAEHSALNELRENTLNAIITMDCSELDKFGVQFVNPESMSDPVNTGDELLLPNHRKNKVKFTRDTMKPKII